MNNPQQSKLIQPPPRRHLCPSWLLPLLLLALPVVVQAQFDYTTNNGTITITRYYGPGGDVAIPGTINGLPVAGIGDSAFWRCPSLTNVTIPSSVTSIGSQAFSDCSGLPSVTIPNSVTNIGVEAFFDCSSLRSVTIPNSITSIGSGAFGVCSNLSAITVDALNHAYSSVDGVLFNKSQTALSQCPGARAGGYTVPNSVTTIGENAFASCGSLTNVAIPNSVTSVGNGAFGGCASLTSVTIPNSVTSIGDWTFSDCTKLTSLTIPNSVTNIGESAFHDCTSLTGVTIPDGVTSIGNSAFWDCTSLTSVTIGSSVTSIGQGAFSNCSRLTNVTIPSGVTTIGDSVFSQCTSLTSVTIPNSVTSIGFDAFVFCSSLTSIVIPNSVTSIEGNAFGGCWRLTNITIPNSVTNIGVEAFFDCSSLRSVTIPNSVTNIGYEAFDYCNSLEAITVDTLNPAFSSLDGVLFNKSQTTLVQYPGGKAGSYIVPNGVTSIGGGAFHSCGGLTSVTTGDTVTCILESAFAGCFSLTTVMIGNSVTSIGAGAFAGCDWLRAVYFQGNAPGVDSSAFALDGATVYYLPGTSGWSSTFCGLQTAMLNPPVPAGSLQVSITPAAVITAGAKWQVDGGVLQPSGATVLGLSVGSHTVSFTTVSGWTTPATQAVAVSANTTATATGVYTNPPAIQTSPQTQTAEAGSAVGLRAEASSPLPLFYLWYLNSTNLLCCSTSGELDLANLQFAQSGAYTVVISNVLGAVTSAPVMLNVIAAVERRPVPGVKVMGETASLVNVDFADSLSSVPNWTPLGSVSLTGTPQYCFDVTLPLTPQRFYRAWQTGTPGVMPSLDLHMVPAITLTGNVGGSVRLDYINQFGPTDAWVTLATVPLTNTSQLYFDISAQGQPPRLYRVVPVP